MAKTLSFTDTSPQTVKIGDTTTSFSLICGNDNVATDLTNATSITVKLGNASGYLKSATVDPTSLTDPTTGQVTVNFNADLMTSLTAGSYAIEVWVVDSTGTSIYPSDGSTGFTITNNIQSANGSVITTITFDDFVKAMNKAASTIKGEKGDKGDKGDTGATGPQGLKGDKGDKGDTGATGPQGLKGDKGDKGDTGDTGTVDNTGLISAPAFQSLQTQVQNSAVGTNLLTGTSNAQNYTASGSGWVLRSQSSNGTNLSIPCTPGASYTYSAIVKSTTYDCCSEIKFYDSSKKLIYISSSVRETDIGVRKTTAVAPTNAAFVVVHMVLNNPSDSQTMVFNSEKLENGSVATDWCPNPSEILTQSDYAKIKAAIVALGGSLS